MGRIELYSVTGELQTFDVDDFDSIRTELNGNIATIWFDGKLLYVNTNQYANVLIMRQK